MPYFWCHYDLFGIPLLKIAVFQNTSTFLSQAKGQPHLCSLLLLGDRQGADTKVAGRPCLAVQGQGDSSKIDKYVTIFTCHPCLLWRARRPARRYCSGYSRLFCSLGKQLASLLLERRRQGQEHHRDEVSWDEIIYNYVMLRSILTAFKDVFIETSNHFPSLRNSYFSRTYQDVFLEYLYGSLRRKRSCTSEERRVFSPTGRAKIGAIAKNRPKNALSFVQWRLLHGKVFCVLLTSRKKFNQKSWINTIYAYKEFLILGNCFTVVKVL